MTSPPPRSATEEATARAADGATADRFARALAARDAATLRGLLADDIDFQALTPGQHWSATGAAQVVDDVIFRHWFSAGDDIRGLVHVTSRRVADRQHLAYRLHVRRDGADFLVEQQAYYSLSGTGRIEWMRLLCSGYRLDPDLSAGSWPTAER